MQNEDVISEESKVGNLFSNLMENVVNFLGIKKEEQCNKIYDLINAIAIKKFKQHPSINLIKKICLTRQLSTL